MSSTDQGPNRLSHKHICCVLFPHAATDYPTFYNKQHIYDTFESYKETIR